MVRAMKRSGKNKVCLAACFCVMMLWAVMSAGGSRVYAASVRDSLPILKLKTLKEMPVPAGSSYLEGGTAVPSGYVVTFLSSSASDPNQILLLSTANWSAVKMGNAPLSHANDMCYVPKNGGEIYVTPMDNSCIIVLDAATLSQKSILTPQTRQTYHAIGYDTKTDSFACMYVDGTGAGRRFTCDILDGKLERKSSFSVSTNLTYQGLTVHNSLIYYTCWERGGVNSLYEPVYDGVFQKNDNVIYVYDFSGRLVKSLLIPCPQGYSKFEIETASFLGDRMILQCNITKNGTRYFGLYEVTGEEPSLAQQAAEKAAKEKAARAQADAERAASAKMKPARPKITGITKKKRAVSLKWKKVKIGNKKVTGYEVQICKNRSFTGDTRRMFRVPIVKCTIRGLDRKTRYFVRVRAYQKVGTGRAYSAWSVIRKVKTK